jgi:hypothetical protein
MNMKHRLIFALVFLALLALIPAVAAANNVPSFDFVTPVFGLAAAPDGSLLVADGGSGIVELRKGEGHQVVALPGVTDVAPIGRGAMFATTGEFGPMASKLWRVSHDEGPVEIADLLAFEIENDPAGGEVQSNPYDVAALNGGTALVADAAGNDLLIVDNEGNVDWVATFPNELAPTDNVRALVGCPEPAVPELAEICDLPPGLPIPAEPVATSVTVGPDGAYYVGELKGFPAPVGMSKVWRIEPGTLHAECGTSSACSVVYDDFTSVIDLNFGPDGKLYVVELDEASWLAVELGAFGLPGAVGGTINACEADGSGCTEVLSPVMIPTAVAIDKKGAAYAAVGALIPGAAQVIALP